MDGISSPRMRVEESPTERSADTTSGRERRSIVLRGVLHGDTTLVRLSGSRWVLGRGGPVDVSLDRPRVSRAHAEIVRRGPVLAIRDLGSTNGTRVDGKRIEHASIGVGSVIRLGEWLGVVEDVETEAGFGELAPGLWGGAMIAESLRILELAVPSRLPVLLVGKTGTGKERFARALHHLSGKDLPFCALNCAAIQPALAEAELFGYRKGSFTGADRSYAGALRNAGKGVLFLDEVAELPLAVQAKLLRALDTGDVAPLGEVAGAHFEARIVAACHEPLSDSVAKGSFREDLAARLAGVVIPLPELRLRRADIPALFDTFLRQYSGGTAPAVSTKLYERLCLYAWPGNVRELELLARQLLAIRGMEPLLRRSHLPPALLPAPEASDAAPVTRSNTVDVDRLSSALKDAGGNVKAAAKMAGISRQRAYRLIGSRRLMNLVSATRESSDLEDDARDD